MAPISKLKKRISNVFFKNWYSYISKIDKQAEVIFMNYGYSEPNNPLALEPHDEPNRYSIQLYHHVSKWGELHGKDVLEVGSGRGGGLSFVHRHFKPKTATGLELNDKAIEFCKNHYKHPNLNFVQGNAEKICFEDNSFDSVLNVESSHRYMNPESFFAEVNRVLRPGGYFLYTDFRPKGKSADVHKALVKANFKIEHHDFITERVVDALRLNTVAREQIVQKLLPTFIHAIGKRFAGTEGSDTYNKFKNNDWEYFFYVLRK
ncbi:MAG TPA: class I SAM-dependent methyltransferase [Bacteroidales bacterium]|nr:class I SAM-dependent methyltransferase [Bacteroidales bacterium]